MNKVASHRRWFQFGLGGLFLAVTAVAMVFWVWPKPPAFVVFGGTLSPADQKAIVAVINSLSTIHDKRILSIEVTTPSTVEVLTGEVRGPLDGGGTIIRLKFESGVWKVFGITSWVS